MMFSFQRLVFMFLFSVYYFFNTKPEAKGFDEVRHAAALVLALQALFALYELLTLYVNSWPELDFLGSIQSTRSAIVLQQLGALLTSDGALTLALTDKSRYLCTYGRRFILNMNAATMNARA